MNVLVFFLFLYCMKNDCFYLKTFNDCICIAASNPCELNCVPRGQNFFYRHRPAVVDGTPCYVGRTDICVDGACRVGTSPQSNDTPPLCTVYLHDIIDLYLLVGFIYQREPLTLVGDLLRSSSLPFSSTLPLSL